MAVMVQHSCLVLVEKKHCAIGSTPPELCPLRWIGMTEFTDELIERLHCVPASARCM
jgi:hypothetical protein